MKKNWIIILIFSLLIMGCGSGNGGSDIATNEKLDSIVNNDSDINESSTASESGISNPGENFKEGVTIAVNMSYILAYPDWEEKIKDAVDFINTVLNRNEGNKKQYAIEKTVVYLDNDIQCIYEGGIENNKFIFNNNYVNSLGTTIILFVYDSENNSKIFNLKNGLSFHRIRTFSSGKKLEEIWISYEISDSPFTNLSPDSERYEMMMQNIIHELGHSLGLAEEEIYRYYFKDFSGELPNLGIFCPWMHSDFLKDPMFSSFLPLRFSDFNSWLINLNAEHKYRGEQVAASIPKEIKIRVVDEFGNPVSDADVKVFATLWGDIWKNVSVTDPILLLETKTDENGEATINSDDREKSEYKGLTVFHKFSPKLAAKSIKVSSNGKYAGKYLLLYDLEKAYLQNKQEVYTTELKLEWFLF